MSRTKVTQKTSQDLLTELKELVDEEKLTAYDVSFSNDDVVFPKHVYSFRHFLHDNKKQIFQDYNDLPDKDTESDAKSLYNITLKACGYLYARYTTSKSKKYLEIIDSIPKESKEFNNIVAYYKEAQTKQAEASQKGVQDPPGSGQGPPGRDQEGDGNIQRKKQQTLTKQQQGKKMTIKEIKKAIVSEGNNIIEGALNDVILTKLNTFIETNSEALQKKQVANRAEKLTKEQEDINACREILDLLSKAQFRGEVSQGWRTLIANIPNYLGEASLAGGGRPNGGGGLSFASRGKSNVPVTSVSDNKQQGIEKTIQEIKEEMFPRSGVFNPDGLTDINYEVLNTFIKTNSVALSSGAALSSVAVDGSTRAAASSKDEEEIKACRELLDLLSNAEFQGDVSQEWRTLIENIPNYLSNAPVPSSRGGEEEQEQLTGGRSRAPMLRNAANMVKTFGGTKQTEEDSRSYEEDLGRSNSDSSQDTKTTGFFSSFGSSKPAAEKPPVVQFTKEELIERIRQDKLTLEKGEKSESFTDLKKLIKLAQQAEVSARELTGDQENAKAFSDQVNYELTRILIKQDKTSFKELGGFGFVVSPKTPDNHLQKVLDLTQGEDTSKSKTKYAMNIKALTEIKKLDKIEFKEKNSSGVVVRKQLPAFYILKEILVFIETNEVTGETSKQFKGHVGLITEKLSAESKGFVQKQLDEFFVEAIKTKIAEQAAEQEIAATQIAAKQEQRDSAEGRPLLPPEQQGEESKSSERKVVARSQTPPLPPRSVASNVLSQQFKKGLKQGPVVLSEMSEQDVDEMSEQKVVAGSQTPPLPPRSVAPNVLSQQFKTVFEVRRDDEEMSERSEKDSATRHEELVGLTTVADDVDVLLADKTNLETIYSQYGYSALNEEIEGRLKMRLAYEVEEQLEAINEALVIMALQKGHIDFDRAAEEIGEEFLNKKGITREAVAGGVSQSSKVPSITGVIAKDVDDLLADKTNLETIYSKYGYSALNEEIEGRLKMRLAYEVEEQLEAINEALVIMALKNGHIDYDQAMSEIEEEVLKANGFTKKAAVVDGSEGPMSDAHSDAKVTQQGPEKEKLDITSFMTEVAAEVKTFGAAIVGDTTKDNCGTKLIFNVEEVAGEFTLTIDGRAAAVLPEIVEQFNTVYQGKKLADLEDESFARDQKSEFNFDRLGDTNQFVITQYDTKTRTTTALTIQGYESLAGKVTDHKAAIEAQKAAELVAAKNAAIQEAQQIDESNIVMFEAIRSAKQAPGSKELHYVGFIKEKVRGCKSQEELAAFLGLDNVLEYTGLNQEDLETEIGSYQQATTFEKIFFHEVEGALTYNDFESLRDFEDAFAPFKDNKYVDPAQKRFVQKALTRDKEEAEKFRTEIQTFTDQIASAETLIAQSKIIEEYEQLIQADQQDKLNYFGDIGQQGLIEHVESFEQNQSAFLESSRAVRDALQADNLIQADKVFRGLADDGFYEGLQGIKDLGAEIGKKIADKSKIFNQQIASIHGNEVPLIDKINALAAVKGELDKSQIETVTKNAALSTLIEQNQNEYAKVIFADLNHKLEACRPGDLTRFKSQRKFDDHIKDLRTNYNQAQLDFNNFLKSEAFRTIANQQFTSQFHELGKSVLDQIEKAQFVEPVRTPERTSTPGGSREQRNTSAFGSVMGARQSGTTSPLFDVGQTLSINPSLTFSSPQPVGQQLSKAALRRQAREQRGLQSTTEASATVGGFTGLFSVGQQQTSEMLGDSSVSRRQDSITLSKAEQRRLAREQRGLQSTTEASATVGGFTGLSSVGQQQSSEMLGDSSVSRRQDSITLSKAPLRRQAREQRVPQQYAPSAIGEEFSSGLFSVGQQQSSEMLGDSSVSRRQDSITLSKAEQRRLAREQREPQQTGGTISWEGKVSRTPSTETRGR